MVEVDKYQSFMADALAFISFSVNMNHSVYVASRMILPGSVSANDINLEVLPVLRKVKITIAMGPLTMNSFVGLGMKRNGDKDAFQAYHQAHQASIMARKRNDDDEIKSTLVFDIPFEPEPQTSKDIQNYPLGHGLRRIKYARGKDFPFQYFCKSEYYFHRCDQFLIIEISKMSC